MLWITVFNQKISTQERAQNDKTTSLNSIRNGSKDSAIQQSTASPLYFYCMCTGTANIGPNAIEKFCQMHYLWLTRCIAQNRIAVRESGSHHKCLRTGVTYGAKSKIASMHTLR